MGQQTPPPGGNGSQGQPAPERHWGSSSTGLCWCGAQATTEHAASANTKKPDGSADTTRGWREG